MANTRIVVVGTSAGGIDALRELVKDIPADFPAPVCIVLHSSPESPGVVPGILSRAGPLPAVHPRDKQRLRPSQIYLAPPDHHLLIEPGRVRVTRGPKENRFRPAIDPLFRSAAQVYGPATIGVILTGNLDDGTAGLWMVRQMGGTVIVQDKADAMFPEMPANAARHVQVDYTVPLRHMAPLLVQLASVTPDQIDVPAGKLLDIEVNIAKAENGWHGIDVLGSPSLYACPECHGVLMELVEEHRVRFRCHIGHAFSLDCLLADIDDGVHRLMEGALRSLQESALLIDQLKEHAERGHPQSDVATLARTAGKARRQAATIRRLLHEWDRHNGFKP